MEHPQDNNGRKPASNELILYRLGLMEKNQDDFLNRIESGLNASQADRIDLRLRMTKNEESIRTINLETIPTVKHDIEELKSKSNTWDTINVALIAVGTFLGIIK